MAGVTFTVNGDYEAALNTVREIFAGQGYTVQQTGNQSMRAERGSQGGSVLLGAFSGKKGRHVYLDINYGESNGNFAISLNKGTSGMSGGLIGMKQANDIYKEAFDAVDAALRSSGTLVSADAFK